MLSLLCATMCKCQSVVIAPKSDDSNCNQDNDCYNIAKGYYKRCGAQISNYYATWDCICAGNGKDSVAILTPFYMYPGCWDCTPPDTIGNDLLVVSDMKTNKIRIYENVLHKRDNMKTYPNLRPTQNGFVIEINLHFGGMDTFVADIYVEDNKIDSIYFESSGTCQYTKTYKFDNLNLDEFDAKMIDSMQVIAHNELCYQPEIITDTFNLDGIHFELQELACGPPSVFHTIQEVFPIFGDTLFFGTYKERLNYKKKMILDCNGSWECLREKDYVLEYYDINYQKNDILNVTLRTENFADTFIGIELFTFDLKEGKNLREEVFINKDKLLEIYRKKIEEDYDDVKKDNDAYDDDDDFFSYGEDIAPVHLSQYEIETDSLGKIVTFRFFHPFRWNMRLVAEFSFEEIKPFLKPEFLQRLGCE
ncbi:MAG: hypothetical protein MJ197_04255 [Bacteroidales bacterium]|nr:hypothetical protein [Bacteroidales bacterium]